MLLVKENAVVTYSDLIHIYVYSLYFYIIMLDTDMLFHLFSAQPIVLVEDAIPSITPAL